MVKGKKGQVKVQQMAFLVIGLTLFFVLVGLFVLSFVFSGLKDSKAAIDEQQATLLVQKLSNTPEFSCARSFGNTRPNCIDLDKVFLLKDKINDYIDFFQVEGIKIITLYPEKSGECTSGNYPDCAEITLFQGKTLGIDKSDFVSLCRKEKIGNYFVDKCELGEVIVRVSNE